MAKKNFIRHLEFYGFPDQNVYNGITNIDLSDIYETNKEQDKEISEISGETESKADLSLVNELSGKVDTFIGIQSGINESFLESLSGVSDNIESLKERDIEITDKINEITDTINELTEGIEENKESIDDLSGRVESIIDSFDGIDEVLSAINESIDAIETELDGKLDSDEAEEIYAKKSEVYSREEADETFLKEHQSLDWVEDDINTLSGMIDTLQEEISDIPSIDENKFVKKTDFEAFEDEYSAYTANTEEEIAYISGAVDSVSASVSSLSETVDTVSAKTDTKLDKTVFNEYIREMDERLADFNSQKADASALTATNAALSNLTGVVNNEIAERVADVAALNSRVDDIASDTSNLETVVTSLSGTVMTFDDRLDQEIADRQAADTALIGTSSDTQSANTIWGAKKYASAQKTIAVSQAKEYTDEVFGTIETELANKFDEIDTNIAKKADKTYVDATVDEKVEDAYETLDAKIDAEENRAKAVELNLQSQINEIVASGSSAEEFEKVYNRLNVITTYSGDSPDHYVNTGNGVLDVLHREFHELEDEIGIVTNPTLQRNNEYESAFGTYNISHTGELDSEKTIFSVGIGTSDDNRKNAIEIMKDGTLYLWVEGEYMNVNDLLSMLAHETYN